MKNLKLVLPVFAIILSLGIIFTQSAFKANPSSKTSVYQYLSNSHLSADIKNISNWELVDAESPSCGTEGTLVCRYQFDGDIVDFQDYLEASTTTAADINENAMSKKQ